MTNSIPSQPIPSRDVLKTQAKRLRADMNTRGTPISHAAALETVAHQWGARDWNTVVAQSAQAPTGWAQGQRVTGRYLSRDFVGVIKAARQASSGFWSLTVRFDEAVDVVTSELFSSFRQQVDVTVNSKGASPQKTSDGVAQMMIDHA